MFHQGRFDNLHPALQAFLDPVDMLAAFNPLLALAAVDPSAALNAMGQATRVLNPALNPAAALLAFNPQAAPVLAVTNPAVAPLTAVAVPPNRQPLGNVWLIAPSARLGWTGPTAGNLWSYPWGNVIGLPVLQAWPPAL